jgi:hypothetical protein
VTIILDANLLLLFVVGSTSRDYIQKHRRLQSYTDDDFILLMKMLSTASSSRVRIGSAPGVITSLCGAYDPALPFLWSAVSMKGGHLPEMNLRVRD